jgi:hypothetical protein
MIGKRFSAPHLVFNTVIGRKRSFGFAANKGNHRRMKTRSFLSLLLLICAVAPALTSHARTGRAHPKLVLALIVDQMRADYLVRYRDLYVDGGFKLLLKRGSNFTQSLYP